MKERVDPERSSQFNRTLLGSACVALILAVLLVGFAYGCARSSRPERPSKPPVPSGMSAVHEQLIFALQRG